MMKKQGMIVQIENGVAKIRVDRDSACGGNCVSCKGCPSASIFVCQRIGEEFSVGDRVRLEKRTKAVLLEAFLGYGLPSIFFIVGACLGYQFWQNERGSVLLGFGALTFAILFVRVFSKNLRRDFTVTKLEDTQ